MYHRITDPDAFNCRSKEFFERRKYPTVTMLIHLTHNTFGIHVYINEETQTNRNECIVCGG